MSKTSRLGLGALGALVIAVALVACGNNDGNSQDEDDITAAMEFAATSGDPAACTEAETQAFSEQNAGGATGEAAVKQCEAEAADTPADSIEVSNVEVDGDAATADGAVTGSIFDGQTLSVALVKENDKWKIDQLTGFAEFDRDAFTAAFAKELASDPETPPKAADCVEQKFAQLSDQEVQDFFVGKAEQQAEKEIFGPCFGAE